MNLLIEKLSNIKNESFVIEIEKDIEEILFWYDKKDNCISVSNRCHFASGDHYELDNTDEIVRLYSEFIHLIK
mgnify:FL=1|tara:strand:+ start:772 stop:990 length:219 start_codon:yes stop_codon:yes gene_type:complete